MVRGGCRFSGDWRFPEEEAALGNHRVQSPASEGGQPWACHGALQGQMQPLLCASGVVGPALGAAAELGRWCVGGAGLPVCGNFKRRRQHSATTPHRALPVCEWPALGMPCGTAISKNAASAVCRRCGGVCTGGCGRGCCAGAFRKLQFCRFRDISKGGGSTRQPQRTEPCQCVSGQP